MYEYVVKYIKVPYVQEIIVKYAENGYRLVTASPVEYYGEKCIMLIFERQVQQ